MDDYTEDEGLEPEEQGAAAVEPVSDKELQKLRKENQSLRQRLRRTELEANFGKDVVELIPEELPLSKWEEFAGRLSERMPKSESPAAEDTQPEEPAQEAEPTGLGGLVNAPAPGTQVPQELLSIKQIKELHKTDPVKADELIRSGKFQQQTNW